MRATMRTVAMALFALAMAAPAAAQRAPQPYIPQPGITATLGVDRSGSFTGMIDPATNQLCYMLNVPFLPNATGAHIALGTPAKPGAPVLTLLAPTTAGAAAGCQTLSPDLAQALEKNADKYSLDVDTAELPTGAVRAQLHGVMS